MAENKIPQNATDILKLLHEFLSGSEEDVTKTPLEKLVSDLKAEGIDTTSLVKMVKERLAKAKAKEELARACEKRQQLLSKFSQKLQQVPSLAKEQVLERVRNLMLTQPEKASAYFRKFDEANESDLQSLINDLSLLNEMGNNDVEG